MRWLLPCTAALGLALGGACSKGSNHVQSPTSAQVAPGQQYEAPDDESVFHEAWDAISTGGKAVAKAGEWTFEKAKDGAIVVGRGTKKVAGKVGEETGDAAIHTALKSRLAADGQVDAGKIDIEVEEGDVTLRGMVSSRAEAAAAIRTALNTRGVDRVTSYLTWQ
jgi:hypothetical protein